MGAFALTESAAKELMSRVRASSCERPTASLNEASEALSTPQEMVDAIERNADEVEMRSLATKYYGDPEQLEFHLDVGLYDEADCPRSDLVTIDGIQFVLPGPMLSLLADCRLDYSGHRFVLVKGERVYRRLLDLAKEQSGAV